jgi:hypothetical protein
VYAQERHVTYLIVGLDRLTFARWHEHVLARDVTSATRIARERAAAAGIDLVLAAIIGPYSSVLSDPAEERAASNGAKSRARFEPDGRRAARAAGIAGVSTAHRSR